MRDAPVRALMAWVTMIAVGTVIVSGSSPALASQRKQLADQRAFIEKLSKEAGAAAQPTAAQTGGAIDFQRAQTDRAYAEEVKARIAAMSQEDKMKLAMQMQQAQSQSALKDVKAMAADSDAVTTAAEHYADYQASASTMNGIRHASSQSA